MAGISGVELSRRFHDDLVGPWLRRAYPGLRYAAALLGGGSELLGFDDELSRDHDWGPRVWIFVSETDFAVGAGEIVEALALSAPETFLGEPIRINRSRPSVSRAGVRADPRHGLEVRTLEAAFGDLGGLAAEPPGARLAWLGVAEQRLLGLTAGAVFRDDDGRLTALRERLGWFPRDVWLYKLAGQWRRIAEEQAFVGRTGMVGDEIGSRVIAARLVRDAMRLTFLIERRYAPYSKWFGSAFAQLPSAPRLTPVLARVLGAGDWPAREAALAEAYLAVARLQRARGVPGAFEPRIEPFHERPFKVINAEAIVAAIRLEIADPALRAPPVIGGLDQVTDSTPVIEAPDRARRMMAGLFDDGEAGAVEDA